MKKLFILSLVFMFFLCSNGFSYEGTPKEQTEGFFKGLMSGKIRQSIDNLYSSNFMMDDKPQELYKQQFLNLQENCFIFL